MTELRVYRPEGLLALHPRAYGGQYASGSVGENRVVDGVATVTVSGPLLQRAGGWFDSYEAVLARVDSALAAKPRALVLNIDSPGGMAQGCFEASTEIKARVSAAGIPLYAFVSGSACSAAYALACAAERIAVTPTAVVGSIGVYETLLDVTKHDQAEGVEYRFASTGPRKTDGNPHVAVTDSALAAAQASAEYLGGLFFLLVEESRGLPAGSARALDGGIAIGAAAVAKRLADVEVLSISQFLASVTTPTPAPTDTKAKAKTMDEIKKALQAVIDSPDSSDDEKAKAKAALAAMDSEPDGDEPVAEKPAEDLATAAKALAEVHKLRAELTRRDEESERSTLLASRPDFAPELVASLRKAPMAMVREMVSTLPRVVPAPAAAASVKPTLGEGQATGTASRLSPEEKAKLDRRMGLAPQGYGIVTVGNEQRFGALVPTTPKQA